MVHGVGPHQVHLVLHPAPTIPPLPTPSSTLTALVAAATPPSFLFQAERHPRTNFPLLAWISAIMSPLQAITHRLPGFVREPMIALIGKECYTTLVWDTDFDSPHCIRYAISKILGFGIVLGGSIVKLPQIVKIVRGKSARGLSLASYLLDTGSLVITVAYNIRHEFPWSTYGENVFLLLQNIMITFLIVLFSSSSNRVPLLVAYVLVMALTTTLLSESIISPAVLKYLVASSIPLALSSKLPQILSNFRMGSTGQLSAFLVFNSLAGCAARVFTTATETGDPLLWWGFVLATALNGVLAIQMAAYWKGGEKERLTTGIRVPEKVLAHATGVQKAVATKVGGGERPTSPASPVVPGKRYVRKLE